MKDSTSNILFFIYYSGHGLMENHTYGVNQMDDRIPIEEWVRKISKFPRVFTIALFDCCRIPV
jgi:hypothetical protein